MIFSLKRLVSDSKNESDYVNISIVIAARNEAENIPNLINHLKNISYPGQMFEVIIVDDNSIDETKNLLLNFTKTLNNFFIFALNDVSGKRNALSMGISRAKYEYILITDADCIPDSGWLKAYSKKFKEGYNLLFGIAPYNQHKKIVNKISCFENLRNSILSFSMALIGIPYTAAARNFGFAKNAFEEIGGYTKTQDTLSGDDDLLIREAVKRKLKIGVVPDKNSFVYSETKKTFSEYLKQRARHTQTSFHYLKTHQLMLGLWHSMNLFFLFSPILIIINPGFGIMLPVKIVIDFILVRLNQKKFGYKFSVQEIVYLQIFYEVLLIIHFLNAKFSQVKWKQ